MSNYDITKGGCADWAQWLEIASPIPDVFEYSGDINVEEASSALILTMFVSNERFESLPRGVKIALVDPKGWSPTNDEDVSERFIYTHDGQPYLAIITNPMPGRWKLHIYSEGKSAFAANLCVFKPLVNAPNVAVSASTPGPPRLRCGICKSVTKALALAIVAAGTLKALPAALIAAVAAYLGLAKVAAAAFINSVLGDGATKIAEKLCKAIGLC
jgi:hypothetical protein